MLKNAGNRFLWSRLRIDTERLEQHTELRVFQQRLQAATKKSGVDYSSILMKRSAATLVSCCTLPRGQRISMESICFSKPSPKKTRFSLDEMNPTLTDT